METQDERIARTISEDAIRDKEIKTEIIRILTQRHNLYMAHWAWRERSIPGMPRVEFYKPFYSHIELFLETDSTFHARYLFQYEYALRDLISEGTVSLVKHETYSLEDPNDFREAHIGDVFLSVPILNRVYAQSVRGSIFRNEGHGNVCALCAGAIGVEK